MTNTDIPLTEATLLLRRLGTTLLGAIARCEPVPHLAHMLEPRDVSLLLPYANLHASVPLTRLSVRPWMKQAMWIVRRSSASGWNPPDLSADVERSVHAGVRRGSQRAWNKLARAWMNQRVGGISPRWLATPLWELAAEMAWGDMTFQNEIARMLLGALRQRVLVTSDHLPVPLITPRTCWACVALAPIGTPQSWRMQLQRGAITRGLRCLQAIAAGYMLTPGWAGVWEQWLMSEALRLWNGAAERVEPPVRTALLALPLHTRLHATVPSGDTPATADVDLATPDWDQDLPSWISILARWDRESAQPDNVQP